MKPNIEILQFGKTAIDELTLRLEQLQTEWSEVNAQRNAWLVILGDENIVPVADSTVEEKKDSPGAVNTEPTEIVRKAIGATGENGFKPKDITTKVEATGINLASGFVSNLLFRMKKRGEVVEHNGKYYLPKFDPKPRLNMESQGS
jgi:hypothetical protein